MPLDKTFRHYTKEQSEAYARSRLGYHQVVEQLIIDHHTATGGKLEVLVDVGCGPGTATRQFAKNFTSVLGIDPSDGMIETARSLGGTTSAGQPIRYEVSTAEDLGTEMAESPVVDGTVDLITAATAAHWFDMELFWPRAAKVLRPGGSVALWIGDVSGLHHSVPNAASINAALMDIEERHLTPYIQPGNRMARTFYERLLLPWQLSESLPGFEEKSLFRKEWNRDESLDEGGTFYSIGEPVGKLEGMDAAMATFSPVTRWREAHPDLVGTEDDVVSMMKAAIAKGLRDAGTDPDEALIKFRVFAVLLMVKKTG